MPTRKNRTPEEKKDHRLELADRLIEMMEKGDAHWQKPWVAGAIQPPVNAVTGKPYRGVNSEYLFAFSPDPTDNRWCTYRQAQEQGWQVRKGEHALAFIEKYTPYERKPTEEERQNRIAQGGDPDVPVQAVSIRHYPVFHASQIDGIPPLERAPKPEIEGKPDPRIDKLAEAMGVQVTRGGGRAFYRSATDTVNLPLVESFHTAAGHDTTFLHELSHATGHESRLNRELGNPFGSEQYALEELRAEMSAAMTAASLGIGFDPEAQGVEEGREMGNSAAYLASWLKALPDKDRKQILMQTIKDAQGISDYLIERTPELQVEAPEREEPERGADLAPEIPAAQSLLTQVPDDVRHFLGVRQAAVTDDLLRGEEKAFFSDKMREMQEIIRQMPATYETDGLPDSERPVSLRYFGPNGAQWFIIEKDRGDPENEGPGFPEQTQAFGLADLGMGYPELGYINIPEITRAGAELDYHFTPATLLEIKREHYPELVREEPSQQQVREGDTVRLILTHRKDLLPHDEQELSSDGLRMEVTHSIPVQEVRGPLLNISQSAYHIGTEEYGPVWVETGFRIGEDSDPVVQFAREAMERRAEVVLTVSDDGLVTTLEDAHEKGRAFATTHDVPARPLALMDEVRHLNAPKLALEERTLRGTLMEVYDTNQVELRDEKGAHIYASAAGPAERDLEGWKALRGKAVSVSADEKGFLQVSPEREINPEIVAHLEERNRVRQAEHPGYAGLGDPVANAEDFTTQFAQRNPVVAREWAEAIRANMPSYSEAADLTPASLALIASQMEAGARRMERPEVGDLVRFEPHDKDPVRGEPFSGRVIAALDTNTGDTRYHLRAETGPDKGVESRVYGRDGTFSRIDIEQAYGFDRNAPERLSPEERAIQEYKAFYDQMPERADKLIAETRERASRLAPADFRGFSEMARDFNKGVDEVFGIIRDGENRGASDPDLRLSEALSTTYIAELPVVKNARKQSRLVTDRFQDLGKALREEFREKLREHGKELLQSGTLQEPREIVQAVYWKHGIEAGPDSPMVDKMTGAVRDKDLKVLLPLIGHNSQNPGSEEAFSRLTGVKLGKTQKERVAQLEAWAGPERVEALSQEREATARSRAEEAPRKAVRQAFDALTGISVRLSETSAESMDGQKWLESKVAEGYTHVGTHKSGAITLRHLKNPDIQQTVWLKDARFQSYCKAIQALEPSGDVMKAMETAKIPLDVKPKEIEAVREPEKAPETKAPNPYEEKQKARQERYFLLAEKARAKALARLGQARKMAEVIPFGQPILVGHHSEGRDRRYRGRIHDTFGKGFKLLEKAEYYERRAKSVNGNAISADDPQAVEKLKAKIETLKAAQERMKAANAAIRKHQKDGPEAQQAALEALGFKPDQAKSLLAPDVMGNIGFASYSLSNNNANIRRLEERVKTLEKASTLEDRTTEFAWGKVRENKEINRIQFLFDGKPDGAVRDLMKKSGFRWAPSEGAWQRQWTGSAVYAARDAIQKLEEWYPASRDREASQQPPGATPTPAPDRPTEQPVPSPAQDTAPAAVIRGRDGTRYALSLREKDGDVLAKLEIAGGETAEAVLQPFISAKIPDVPKLAARMELSDGRAFAVRLSPGNGGVEADVLCSSVPEWQSFTWKRLNEVPGKLRADGVNSPEAKWVAERLGVDARVMRRQELAAGVGGYRAPEKTREQAKGMGR